MGPVRRRASPKLARRKYCDVDQGIEFVDLELCEVTGPGYDHRKIRPDALCNLANERRFA
jgi:hypothetical protein